MFWSGPRASATLKYRHHVICYGDTMVSIKVTNVGVDSGTIFIGDVEALKEAGADREGWEADEKNIFEVKPGEYEASYVIPDTWNGRVENKGKVTITSGRMLVADPCYSFSHETKSWKNLLDRTNYFRKADPIPGAIIEDGMGGDGSYKVNITLRKVEA